MDTKKTTKPTTKIVGNGYCVPASINGPHKYRINGESAEMRRFGEMFGAKWGR